ncbi:hypothetical protein BDV37DRAFT_238937 [Aspergillus pseudonomiae]|uniref:Uncharacterized protein n=1 Tax=Aspergillus pseudonomiae TaxID=1506151 RepID=A0A5N7DNW8_9EURO|nr:uncharacterized protein BDV37DRAFT_238937 [Aspergillus pseudonomiae]KAE8408160.1 hypothetical protein BDV37DRAFT_238937 [Aspergillus pseudonomiae]
MAHGEGQKRGTSTSSRRQNSKETLEQRKLTVAQDASGQCLPPGKRQHQPGLGCTSPIRWPRWKIGCRPSHTRPCDGVIDLHG